MSNDDQDYTCLSQLPPHFQHPPPPWPTCDPTTPPTWSPRLSTLKTILALVRFDNFLYLLSPFFSGKRTLALLLRSYILHHDPTAQVLILPASTLTDKPLPNNTRGIYPALVEHGFLPKPPPEKYYATMNNTYVFLLGAEALYMKNSFWNAVKGKAGKSNGEKLVVFATLGVPGSGQPMKFPGLVQEDRVGNASLNTIVEKGWMVLARPVEWEEGDWFKHEAGVCLGREEVGEGLERAGVGKGWGEVVWGLTEGHGGAVRMVCEVLMEEQKGGVLEEDEGMAYEFGDKYIRRLVSLVNSQPPEIRGFPLLKDKDRLQAVFNCLAKVLKEGEPSLELHDFQKIKEENRVLLECATKGYLILEAIAPNYPPPPHSRPPPQPTSDLTIPPTFSPRTQTVQTLHHHWTHKANNFLYIRAPASSGKSTLAHLLASHIRTTNPTSFTALTTGAAILTRLNNSHLDCDLALIPSLLRSHGWNGKRRPETYLIIDDAEVLYEDWGFWKALMYQAEDWTKVAVFATLGGGEPLTFPGFGMRGIPLSWNMNVGPQPWEYVEVGVYLTRVEVGEVMERCGVSRERWEVVVWGVTEGHAGAVGVVCLVLKGDGGGEESEKMDFVVDGIEGRSQNEVGALSTGRIGLYARHKGWWCPYGLPSPLALALSKYGSCLELDDRQTEKLVQIVNGENAASGLNLRGFPLIKDIESADGRVVEHLRNCCEHGEILVSYWASFIKIVEEDPALYECITDCTQTQAIQALQDTHTGNNAIEAAMSILSGTYPETESANPNGYSGLPDEFDIELVMHETGCSREKAIRALKKKGNDIVGALTWLGYPPENGSPDCKKNDYRRDLAKGCPGVVRGWLEDALLELNSI
ncbi:hypothetical protein BJ508DRAFT_329693 [Ascobolus immersus RN42]|uniref:Nascent polypeptide-associated complex subunit alpha-like UBA domain-containing protein n=1 Tax=Ascobolus immersus RN42 TaxID=1160509 RepID=A0A3N4I813_ASCIM|nr:hypothetical protein BJ508DRAFT_329693 [Ascobolus immersus RN42]